MSKLVCYVTLDWLNSISESDVKDTLLEINKLCPNHSKVLIGNFNDTKLKSKVVERFTALKHVWGYGLSHIPPSTRKECLTNSYLIMDLSINIIQGNYDEVTVFASTQQFEVLRTLAEQTDTKLTLYN